MVKKYLAFIVLVTVALCGTVQAQASPSEFVEACSRQIKSAEAGSPKAKAECECIEQKALPLLTMPAFRKGMRQTFMLAPVPDTELKLAVINHNISRMVNEHNANGEMAEPSTQKTVSEIKQFSEMILRCKNE